jgi:septum formation protein
MPLILASRSPQRRAILAQLGIAFEVVEVDVEERMSGVAHEVARDNALAKALAGAALRPGETVLGGGRRNDPETALRAHAQGHQRPRAHQIRQPSGCA